jgi:hypothetical protein
MIEKEAVKDMFYGGLLEIMNNSRYYYKSSVNAEFSHFTDQGKTFIEEYVKYIAIMMLRVEEESLNKRAKEMVINGLKGENI